MINTIHCAECGCGFDVRAFKDPELGFVKVRGTCPNCAEINEHTVMGVGKVEMEVPF